MWFGIGKMCLEKKYDHNINVPNNYARTVRCAHFTQSTCDHEIESESELRALIQMCFQYPAYW